jgi:hypothetical protein
MFDRNQLETRTRERNNNGNNMMNRYHTQKDYINANANNATQTQQRRNHENMLRFKEEQQRRYMQKMKQIEENMNDERIFESVIQPKSIKNSGNDKMQLEKKYQRMEKAKENELTEHWNKRTNKPYKNIIKDEQHIVKFTHNPKRKINENELIVHEVTQKDRNINKLENDYEKLEDNVNVHNKELKEAYCDEKKMGHVEQFNYRYNFEDRQKSKTSDHGKLKGEKMKYYIEQQKKMDKGNIEKDEILRTLETNEIFLGNGKSDNNDKSNKDKSNKDKSNVDKELEKYNNRQKNNNTNNNRLQISQSKINTYRTRQKKK